MRMAEYTTSLDPVALARVAAVIKCLGHPLRLLLLEGLESGEKTVAELQAFSGATQAMVSQQLATLRGHGVVTARRDGTYVRYSICEPKVHTILDCVRGCGGRGQEQP
jgi:DNA-binding transcriptional ArsR family regulator